MKLKTGDRVRITVEGIVTEAEGPHYSGAVITDDLGFFHEIYVDEHEPSVEVEKILPEPYNGQLWKVKTSISHSIYAVVEGRFVNVDTGEAYARNEFFTRNKNHVIEKIYDR